MNMKKIFVSLLVFTILFTSCEKKESVQDNSNALQEIKAVSKIMSAQHDAVVLEMIEAFDELDINDAFRGEENDFAVMMERVVDVINDVTGIQAQVLNKDISVSEMKRIAGSNAATYDFDQEEISLAAYTSSFDLEPYFDAIDVIVNDVSIELEDKIEQINYYQNKILSDASIQVEEIEQFMNTTEVLKGSLSLWNDKAIDNIARVSNSGAMYASDLTKLSFLKKLAFVAAADAVGAVVGSFLGGIITISGVPIYVPAGPQGAVAGLAALSFIASKMVGW